MARRVEELVVDMNVFVDGVSFLGVATGFKPPSIEMSSIESESSSAGKMNLYWGAFENFEAEFTLTVHDEAVYDEMKKCNEGKLLFKASVSTGELCQTKVISYELDGQISGLEDNEVKRGEKISTTVKMGSCWYYKKMINGKNVFEVDKKNGISKPDGKIDRLAKARNDVTS